MSTFLIIYLISVLTCWLSLSTLSNQNDRDIFEVDFNIVRKFHMEGWLEISIILVIIFIPILNTGYAIGETITFIKKLAVRVGL